MGYQSKAKQRRRAERDAARQRLLARAEARRAEAEALFDQFEAVLQANRIAVRPGSNLEQALLLVRQLRYIREEDAPLPDLTPAEEDAMWRRVCWLWGMAPKVVSATGHPDFRALVPHLKLVVESEFAQSVPGFPDEGADKLFELVVALAILPHATNLRMDTGNAPAANPDLLFDFRGVRWAIACKGLYSRQPRTYLEAVKKGAQQIERSEAARGVVCVSLRNFIDQDQFLARNDRGLLAVRREAIRPMLEAEEARFKREIIEPVRADIGEDLRTRRNVEPSVLHVSAACVRTAPTEEDVRLTYVARVMDYGDCDEALVDALNEGLQAVQPPLR